MNSVRNGGWKKIAAYVCGAIALVVNFVHLYLRKADFNFVDEFNNYIAAYFVQRGQALFSDHFFNHQPLMVWLSQVVLQLTRPQTLYHYVVYHRYAMLGILFGISLFFVMRLRLVGFVFLILYQYFSFYLFGFTFQAESITAYIAAYLLFLIWQRWHDRPLYWFDYLLVGVSVWFTFYARETVFPLVGFLYLCLMLPIRSVRRWYILAWALPFITIPLTLFALPLPDWWYQVVVFNKQAVSGEEIALQGGPFLTLLKSAFYWVYTFFGVTYNHYHIGSMGLVATLLIGLALWVRRSSFPARKKWQFLAFLFIAGTLAALRPVTPGEQFYGTYRISAWVALVVMVVSIIGTQIPAGWYKKAVLLLILYVYLAPASYLYSLPKVSPADQYFISYNQYETYGRAIQLLALPQNTMFIEGYDVLPYIVAGLPSSFPGNTFYPPQQQVDRYRNARTTMFATQPPDFYIRNCPLTKAEQAAPPPPYLANYTNLKKDTKLSCLFVKSTLLKKITPDQWNAAAAHGWAKPKIAEK